MLNKLLVIFIAILLTACGGSGSTAPATPDTQQPATQPPATSAGAIVLSGTSLSLGSTGGDYLIQSASTIDVTLSSVASNVTFAQNQAAGTVIISGTSNLVIFRNGATVTSLNVSGTSNTIWIPTGAQITFASAPAITNTVNYYTP